MDLNLRIFDALMPLIGLVGIWPALVLLFKSTSPNPAERRLKYVLLVMGSALLFRAGYVYTGKIWLGAIVYSLFILNILYVFLYYETLLRRHFPLLLKIFMVVGSAIFLGFTLAGQMPHELLVLRAFLIFVTIGQGWVLAMIFTRNRDDYSRSENRYIDLTVITLLVLSPFFFTDISSFKLGDFPRMGTLGALFFTYVSINAEQLFENSKRLYGKAIKVFLFSLILTGAVLSLLPHQSGAVQSRVFVLFLCVNLIFRIYYAVKHVTGADTLSRFLEKVQESPKNSRDEFLRDMNQIFSGVRKQMITAKELPLSESKGIAEVFLSRQASVFSIYELRQIVEDPAVVAGTTLQDLESIEKMIHLLEEKKMNHLCLVDPDDGVYLLFDLIAIGYGRQIRLQAGFSVEMARMIKAVSSTQAAPTSQSRLNQ